MDDDHAINITRDILKKRVTDLPDLDTAPNTKKTKPTPTTKIDIGKREATTKTKKPGKSDKGENDDTEMEEH